MKSIEVLTSLTSDPDLHLAEAMAKFETDTADNFELQELFKQAGDGNRTAAALAQKMIANHQLDGCKYFVCLVGGRRWRAAGQG